MRLGAAPTSDLLSALPDLLSRIDLDELMKKDEPPFTFPKTLEDFEYAFNAGKRCCFPPVWGEGRVQPWTAQRPIDRTVREGTAAQGYRGCVRVSVHAGP